MIAYLDTSAFVKLVLDEDGAADARSWFEGGWPAISSVITYPEACSALGRRAHDEPQSKLLETWIEQLDACWRRVLSVQVGAELAGRLALRHELRGMDAVQLAAAVRTRERLREQGSQNSLRFASFDRRLLEAAEREGFATLGGPSA